uniref:Rad51 domain-containing protein n=1 Tax=Macrostomum lignano TaxID=282301 RepID=A0A1I8FQ85_9PLAT
MQLTVRDALARCTNDGAAAAAAFGCQTLRKLCYLMWLEGRPVALPAHRTGWQCRLGKTQLCIVRLVQLPAAPGRPPRRRRLSGHEGSFSPRRQAQIASGLLLHCRRLADRMRQRRLPPGDDDDGNGVEGGGDGGDGPLTKLCAFAHESLERFLVGHPHVRLIVLDSIASPFRYEFDNAGQRNRQLARARRPAHRLAVSCRLAVLCTNQMTTRFGLTDAADSRVEPALGPSWCHVCNIRLVIERLEGGGAAAVARISGEGMRVLKHPAVRAGSSAVFQVKVQSKFLREFLKFVHRRFDQPHSDTIMVYKLVQWYHDKNTCTGACDTIAALTVASLCTAATCLRTVHVMQLLALIIGTGSRPSGLLAAGHL